jgi:hypothetical protein
MIIFVAMLYSFVAFPCMLPATDFVVKYEQSFLMNLEIARVCVNIYAAGDAIKC